MDCPEFAIFRGVFTLFRPRRQSFRAFLRRLAASFCTRNPRKQAEFRFFLPAERFLSQRAIGGRFRPPMARRKSLCGNRLRNAEFQ
jgi:hypothetical protein